MPDHLRFSTFDLSKALAPERCAICTVSPAAFQYGLASDRPGVETLNGYCCSSCARAILRSVEQLQIYEWAELTLETRFPEMRPDANGRL